MERLLQLQISDKDLVANLIAITEFEHRYQLAKLGKPIDREEWLMPPQMVNAYYNPQMNEIVFPAGILQPPFFNLSADDAVNYGVLALSSAMRLVTVLTTRAASMMDRAI